MRVQAPHVCARSILETSWERRQKRTGASPHKQNPNLLHPCSVAPDGETITCTSGLGTSTGRAVRQALWKLINVREGIDNAIHTYHTIFF